MKKYIKLLSELASIDLFLIRYIVNFIILVEIIYLPIILSKDDYVQIEYFKNIIIFIPILLMGINSGYINIYYKQQIDYRKELIILGLMISLLSALVVYVISSNLFFVFATFCFVFIFSIEKILIIDGYLILSSVYKAFFSISLILLVSFFEIENNLEMVYSVSIIIGFIIWMLFIYLKYKEIFVFRLKIGFLRLINIFFILVKEGFLIALQSFILIGYFLFDRWFIITNYSQHIAEYSISFSFAQIVFIALNTIAFSMQRKLGENLKTYTKNKINNILTINIVFFIVVSIISLFIVYLIIHYSFFEEYGDFLFSFLIILLFYGFYYTLSTYNVIALYSGLAKKLLLIIFVGLIFNIIASYITYLMAFSYYVLLIKSGIILFIVATLIFIDVLRCVKND